jgi:hypothetical protein
MILVHGCFSVDFLLWLFSDSLDLFNECILNKLSPGVVLIIITILWEYNNTAGLMVLCERLITHSTKDFTRIPSITIILDPVA